MQEEKIKKLVRLYKSFSYYAKKDLKKFLRTKDHKYLQNAIKNYSKENNVRQQVNNILG